MEDRDGHVCVVCGKKCVSSEHLDAHRHAEHPYNESIRLTEAASSWSTTSSSFEQVVVMISHRITNML